MTPPSWSCGMPSIPPESGHSPEHALPDDVRRLKAALAEREAQLLQRTRELRTAQEELQRTNSELLHLTLELEDRIVARTQELAGANAILREEVRRRQAVEATLRERSEQLRALASELTQAEERERERLATVLHDDLQQLLVGMKVVASPLAQAAEPKVREVGRELRDLIMRSLQCSRSLTEELSPPILHRSGLVPALDWLANWMEERYQLHVEIRANGSVAIENHETAILLFRALRELLFNAAKHARVQTATVEIVQREGLVRACVSDPGAGFDPSLLRMAGGTAGGFGLFHIRERLEYLGGGLDIESAPEKGSRFTLWLPLTQTAGPVDTAPGVGLP